MKTLQLYFASFRFSVLDTRLWRWGMESGGISFAPVALLGLLGLFSGLRAWRRNLLWLALVATGLAVPLLSVATPRRLLVFDLGWCALAGLGLLRVIDWKPFRAVSPIVPKLLAAALFVGLGGWSFASIALLHRAAAALEPATSIPFANAAWINDGRSCWRCMEAGHAWQEEIEADRFVVLFDTDVMRENRTTPGGLPLHGKLAALAAGKHGSFVEFYPTVRNFDVEPPLIGPVFDASSKDFASFLIERIEAARPDEIVWHFEVPTQWERWLAERLSAVGGVASSFETPLGPTPGLQVRTEWSRREAAFEILRELASVRPSRHDGAITLREVSSGPVPGHPLELAAPPGAPTVAAPEWIVRDWREIRFGALSVPLVFPGPDVIGFAVEVGGGGMRAQYLTRGGGYVKLRRVERRALRAEPALPAIRGAVLRPADRRTLVGRGPDLGKPPHPRRARLASRPPGGSLDRHHPRPSGRAGPGVCRSTDPRLRRRERKGHSSVPGDGLAFPAGRLRGVRASARRRGLVRHLQPSALPPRVLRPRWHTAHDGPSRLTPRRSRPTASRASVRRGHCSGSESTTTIW